MKAVVQRVTKAKVTPVGEIGPGLCVLLGVARGDGGEEAARLAGKIARLRVFEDEAGGSTAASSTTRRRRARRLAVHADRRHGEGQPAELLRRRSARGGRAALRALLRGAARARRARGEGRLRRAHGGRARERRAGDDRARMSFRAGRSLIVTTRSRPGGGRHVTDAAAGRHAQGVFRARERRRTARLGAARPVLRGLAGVPRDPRRREPAPSTPRPRASGTARRSGAAPTSARRGRTRARASRTTPTAGARSRRSRTSPSGTAACSSASRRPGSSRAATRGATWSLLSTLAGQPGSEAWDDPANQPPGHLGISALMFDTDDDGALLGDRPGHRPVRDDRRREDVDAAQPRAARRLAARARGGRFLRAQARPLARRRRPHVPAEPRRHAPHRRRAATRGRRSPKACRPSSASPRRRIRTTATRSTSSRSTRGTAGRCPTATRPSGARATPGRAGSARPRPAAARRVRRRPARGDGDRLVRRARPLLRDEHRAGLRERRRGRELDGDRRATCRRSRPSRSRSSTDGRRPPARAR